MWMLILSAFLLGMIIGFLIGCLTIAQLSANRVRQGLYCTKDGYYKCEKIKKGDE